MWTMVNIEREIVGDIWWYCYFSNEELYLMRDNRIECTHILKGRSILILGTRVMKNVCIEQYLKEVSYDRHLWVVVGKVICEYWQALDSIFCFFNFLCYWNFVITSYYLSHFLTRKNDLTKGESFEKREYLLK